MATVVAVLALGVLVMTAACRICGTLICGSTYPADDPDRAAKEWQMFAGLFGQHCAVYHKRQFSAAAQTGALVGCELHGLIMLRQAVAGADATLQETLTTARASLHRMIDAVLDSPETPQVATPPASTRTLLVKN